MLAIGLLSIAWCSEPTAQLLLALDDRSGNICGRSTPVESVVLRREFCLLVEMGERTLMRLDVSPERVRKLIARRAIPHYQDGHGCRIFLRRRELDEWKSASRLGTVATSHNSRTALGGL